jgi:DNA-binding transcriptional ArsR family regulator
VDVFAALADPVRRNLVNQLAAGPARVVDLAAAHAISRPAISRHLRVLGDAGLVTVQDVGRERHYRIAPAGLAPVRDFLDGLSPTPRFAETAFDGLDLEVRRTVHERRTRATSTTSAPTEETA